MTHATTPSEPTPDHHARPPAPAPRGCLHCGYPLADRPIGTICPECGKPDTRVCAACNASLDGLFDHDQCRSCGLPVDRALNATLLSRLSPEALARAEDASWVRVIAAPIGVITGLSVVAEDASVAASFVVVLTVLIPSCAAWLAAVTPEGLIAPRRLAFLRSAVRCTASAALVLVVLLFLFVVFVYQPGVILAALGLLPVHGAMCLASGLHASALCRSTLHHRSLPKRPLWISEWLSFILIICIAGGVLSVAAIAYVMASIPIYASVFLSVIAISLLALPAYAWYRWLILAIRARKIRHQRRAAGAPATSQQPTPHDR